MADKFDPKLIPEFDSINPNQSIVKWTEKVELVFICCIMSLNKEKKGDFSCIKNALYTVFVTFLVL